MKKLESHAYWSELVLLKDDLSLRELSERFGATPGAIMNAFRRNGIKRQNAPPGPRKHRQDKALPPEPGEARSVADRLGEHVSLLGKVPDIEVAKKSGVSLRAVSAFRESKGIAGFGGRSAGKGWSGKGQAPPKARKRPGRTSKIDAFAAEVGTTTDRIIAQRAGVTINAVRNWRRQRKIAALAGEVAKAPASAPGASRGRGSSGSYAWRVVLADGQVGVVVGADIAEAAARASRAGEAASIERLGTILA